jgi:hypothetical protein
VKRVGPAEAEMVRTLIAGLRNPEVAAAIVILVNRAGEKEIVAIGDAGCTVDARQVVVDVVAPARRAAAVVA